MSLQTVDPEHRVEVAHFEIDHGDEAELACGMLRANGIDVEISGDDLAVRGRGHAEGGGLVATHMDHRIAMAALVLGLAADKPVMVDDASFIATSFPGFADLMRGLGGDLQ